MSDREPLPPIPGYRLLRHVAGGGMGDVYEAEQQALARRVAVKVMKPALGRSAGFRERFRREARAAGLLHHTNIVPVFDSGEADGRLYYAMQFIPGRGLNAVLADLAHGGTWASPAGHDPDALTLTALPPTVALPHEAFAAEPEAPTAADPVPVVRPASERLAVIRRLCVLLADAADAIQYAHERGILHRDVKPSNLLLDDAGVLWVADFGLARWEEDGDALTGSQELPGTPRYMAPERFRQECGRPADVYALGLTVYEAVLLRPAYEGPGDAAMAVRISNTAPPRPRAVDPTVPRDLETVILTAIARDPRDRYPSAGRLAADLRRFAAGEAVSVRRPNWVRQGWRWCRRNRAVAALLALVLLVTTAGGAVAAVLALRAEASAAAADASREDARALLHIASVKLAEAAWNEGDARVAADMLAALAPAAGEPDRRGWEWYEMTRSREAFPPIRPSAPLAPDTPAGRLAVSADGAEFVATSEYDPAAGRLPIRAVATRSVIRAAAVSGRPLLAAFTPDGGLIAVTARHLERVGPDGRGWRVELSGLVRANPRAVGVSADGRWVAVGGQAADRQADGVILIRDAAAGTERATLRLTAGGNARDRRVNDLAFLPNGQLLAGCQDARVRRWSAAFAAESPLPVLADARRDVRRVAFLPDDGTVLALIRDQLLRSRLDAPDPLLPSSPLAAVKFGFDSLAVDADGGELLCGDRLSGRLCGGSVAPGNAEPIPGIPEGVADVAFTRCGRYAIVLGESGGLYFRDRLSGLPHLALPAPASRTGSFAVSACGRMVAAVDEVEPTPAVTLFDRATMLPLGRRSLTAHPNGPRNNPVFTARGELLVGDGAAVRVLDPLTGVTRRLLPAPPAAFRYWAVNPAGDTAYFRSRGGLHPVDAVTGLPAAVVPALTGADIPAERTVAANHWLAESFAGQTRLTVAPIDRLAERRELPLPGGPLRPGEYIRWLTADPAGRWLCAARSIGTAVMVWPADDWDAPFELAGHSGELVAAAFHPDGRRLASTDGDGVKLWDLVRRQELRHLRMNRGWFDKLAFTPDGGQLFGYQSSNAEMTVWDASPNPPTPIDREAAGLLAHLTTRTHRQTGRVWGQLPSDFRKAVAEFPHVAAPVRERALEIVDDVLRRQVSFDEPAKN
jgi:serine/threonine protein kinase/WD40 repeat protein